MEFNPRNMLLTLVEEAMIACYVKKDLPDGKMISSNTNILEQRINAIIMGLANCTPIPDIAKNEGIYVEKIKKEIRLTTFLLQNITNQVIVNARLSEEELINIINNKEEFKFQFEQIFKNLK